MLPDYFPIVTDIEILDLAIALDIPINLFAYLDAFGAFIDA